MRYNLNEEYKKIGKQYFNESFDANQMKVLEKIQDKIAFAIQETAKKFPGLKMSRGQVNISALYENAVNGFLNKMANIYAGKSKIEKGIQYISFADKQSAVKFYNLVKTDGEENGINLRDLSAVKEEQKRRLLIFKDAFFVVEYKIAQSISKELVKEAQTDPFLLNYMYPGFLVDSGKAIDFKIDEMAQKNINKKDFWQSFSIGNGNASYSSGEFKGYGKERPEDAKQGGSMMYSQGRENTTGGYNSHSAPWD